MTIGIIDSGVDTTIAEFAGRISPASGDAASNRGVAWEDDHGTLVALVAAAARNNSGVMGIAFESTILSQRADSPGSCATTNGCAFFDSAIALGIDRAVQGGAKVINLSLGGSPPNNALRNAIARAAAAGVVVVVSAGNDADAATPSQDPNNPDPFATGLRQAGDGNVIIAGSVNSAGTLSDFANRAGSEASWYLGALGDLVCCVYENGAIKITTVNGQQFVSVVSGTSFSAPQISGAAALLRQAFPNLTAKQVVSLLLSSARDAGTAGTDSTYGRGILDIGAAFAPQGQMSLASSLVALPLGDSTGSTSLAMGDAVQTAQLSAVMLDGYNRAYRIQLGNRLQSAQVDPRLGAALLNPMEQVTGGAGSVTLGFSVDRRGRLAATPWQGKLRLSRADAEISRVLAGRIVARIAPRTSIAFGFAQGADGLVAQVQGHSQPAFLIARSPADDFGITLGKQNSFALRRQFAGFGLTLAAAHGNAESWRNPLLAASQPRPRKDGVTRLGLALDRRFGALDTALSASWLSEQRTILGARLHDAFGPRGADSLFLDARAAWAFAPQWRLAGAWRQGFTHARAGGAITAGSKLASTAWSLDLERRALFAASDTLALRVSQPLRVGSGGVRLDLPVAYDYDTLATTNAFTNLSLAPKGRELDAELAWRGPLRGGAASASLFYRRNPGHHAALPADKGVALSWKTEF